MLLSPFCQKSRGVSGQARGSGRRCPGGVLPTLSKAEFPVFRRFFFFPVFPGVFRTPSNTKIISSLIDPLKYLKNVIFLYPFLYLDRKNTPLSGGARLADLREKKKKVRPSPVSPSNRRKRCNTLHLSHSHTQGKGTTMPLSPSHTQEKAKHKEKAQPCSSLTPTHKENVQPCCIPVSPTHNKKA